MNTQVARVSRALSARASPPRSHRKPVMAPSARSVPVFFSKASTYTKAGYGAAGLVGTGVSASVFVKAGAGIAGNVGSGSGASVFARNGWAAAGTIGAGASATVAQETGYGTVGGFGFSAETGYGQVGTTAAGAGVGTKSASTSTQRAGTGGSAPVKSARCCLRMAAASCCSRTERATARVPLGLYRLRRLRWVAQETGFRHCRYRRFWCWRRSAQRRGVVCGRSSGSRNIDVHQQEGRIRHCRRGRVG